ncbi:hypothetical protein QQF64_017795 [Cirrhinus molitorella]|uniref:Uncharacterized protein n=1 Tax=Cirrhinus molitorella TaxID=172907 RepID=A0ABR3LJN9_9TELE
MVVARLPGIFRMVKGLPVELFASGCDALDARLGLGRVNTPFTFIPLDKLEMSPVQVSSSLDWIQCLILPRRKVWILLHFMTVTAHHKVGVCPVLFP